MFCPNCGVEIKTSNQNFCYSCGYRIKLTSGAPQVQARYIPAAIPKQTISMEKPVVNQDRPGPYSIKCFVLSIVSIVLVVITFILGANVLSYLILSLISRNYYRIDFATIIIIGIVILIINGVGLILGILSKVFSKKAIELEPNNPLEKVGSVFLIFGIVLNCISLGGAFIVLGFFL
ncbi:MAG: zinc ribbon domain-containing protein [Promethearchaeota archaeon]|nr:MAG: zinc ribbon domain-containing protein [Candidatus Lokiarchaeota archaeon]